MDVVAVDAIVQVEGRNPRRELGDITELKASMKLHGLLQPVVVEESQNGEVTLVTGNRRLAAARELGWSTIPVYAVKANPDAAALVENIQRLGLNPVDEAAAFARLLESGMKVPGIAKAMSVSRETVQSRLALLKLPEACRERIADGRIPLGGVPLLTKLVEEASPEFAAAFADWSVTHVDGDAPDWGDIIRDPGEAVSVATAYAMEGPLDSIRHFNAFTSIDASRITSDPDLLARAAKLPYALGIDRTDLDAARAYGCLMEFPARFSGASFCTDLKWLDAHAETMIVHAEESHAKYDKPDVDPDERKQKREEAKAEAASAALANVNLGVTLQKELHTATLTLERAKLLALIVLKHYSTEIGFALSWALEDSEFEVDVTRKDGTIRTKKVKDPVRMGKEFEGEIMLCKKPGQVLGMLMQGLMAMVLVDPASAPQSQRVPAPWALVTDRAFLDYVQADVPEGISERLTERFAGQLSRYAVEEES